MRLLVPILALAACAAPPPPADLRIPPAVEGAPAPNLVPLAPLLAAADRPSRAQAAGADLAARAARVRARAPAVPTSVGLQARARRLDARAAALLGTALAADAPLEARARRLRARAEALRAAPL